MFTVENNSNNAMSENVNGEQDDNLDRIVNKGLAKFEHSSLSCFKAIKCFNLIKCQKGCWFSVLNITAKYRNHLLIVLV